MGFRFRKTFSLGRGVRINLSKSGIGGSFGIPGLRFGIGPRGARATASIPGTGISWSEQLGRGRGWIRLAAWIVAAIVVVLVLIGAFAKRHASEPAVKSVDARPRSRLVPSQGSPIPLVTQATPLPNPRAILISDRRPASVSRSPGWLGNVLIDENRIAVGIS
jgi:hypothetical protein